VGLESDAIFFILEIISISANTSFLIPAAECFSECLNLALRLIYIKAIHGHAAPIDGDWIGFVGVDYVVDLECITIVYQQGRIQITSRSRSSI